MHLKNVLISSLLIFAYLIGFAHELIPHYHLEDEHHDAQHVAFHNHVSVENRDADDITHGDHLDDSFLDYLVCIISHSEHSNLGSDSYLHQGIDYSIDKFTPSIQSSIIEQEKNLLVPNKKTTKVISKPLTTQWMELCSIQSRRGPPTFS